MSLCFFTFFVFFFGGWWGERAHPALLMSSASVLEGLREPYGTQGLAQVCPAQGPHTLPCPSSSLTLSEPPFQAGGDQAKAWQSPSQAFWELCRSTGRRALCANVIG